MQPRSGAGSQRVILGMFTDVLGHGGVQRFGRQYAIALTEFAASRGEELLILSLNDPEGDHVIHAFGKQARITGFNRSRKNFVKACLRNAPRARAAFINHAFLSPIALGMRLRNRAMNYIVAVYGIEVWTRMSLLRRMGMRGAQTVLTIAEFNREQMRSTQGITSGPALEVIPPPYESTLERQGADDAEWAAAGIQKPYVLCVCRINKADHRKYVESLIRAFGKLHNDFPEWACYHVGNGDDRPRLESIARDCAPGFRFLGAASDGLLNRLYRECELFVMPSEKEGFGIVFLEAMAHAKPVIGGNAGGTPDIIPDGVIGYLIDPKNIDQLAERMRSLMKDESLRGRLGAAGRERLRDVYTPAKFLARMNEVLARL